MSNAIVDGIILEMIHGLLILFSFLKLIATTFFLTRGSWRSVVLLFDFSLFLNIYAIKQAANSSLLKIIPPFLAHFKCCF